MILKTRAAKWPVKFLTYTQKNWSKKSFENFLSLRQDNSFLFFLYFELIDIFIPGIVNGKKAPGAGKVYVQYETKEDAGKCKSALQGRHFAQRTVVVAYYEPEKFANRDFQ